MTNRHCHQANPLPIGATYEETVLPHLSAARRLARWLVHNDDDAEDVVQDAALRAFRYFDTFTGGNGRAWFLQIVRNSCHGWRGPRLREATDPFDEQQHSPMNTVNDPERLLLKTDNVALIELALNRLPERFRQLLVLREIDGLTYGEIARALDIPMGTVMSGLSRSRQAMRRALADQLTEFNATTRSRHETSDTHF